VKFDWFDWSASRCSRKRQRGREDYSANVR